MKLKPDNFIPYNPANILLETQEILIGPGCLGHFRDELSELGLDSTTVCAIYDVNTFKATGGIESDVDIVLNPLDLHADERGVAMLSARLDSVCSNTISVNYILTAVGAGTIHDLTRYCAGLRNMPFVSVPTAASMDGFASGVSAMTWHGFKKTLPGTAPVMILADTEIIAAAPARLTLSGIGDLIGKYISLCDWQAANILTGEFYSDEIAALMQMAVDDVMASVMSGETVHEKLIYGLILSGVAMKLAGSSRPASGAEHHISHMLEMGIPQHTGAMHGEKVGVAALECADIYKRLLNIADVSHLIIPDSPLDREEIMAVFGNLGDSIVEENRDDDLPELHSETIDEKWGEIMRVVAKVPSRDQLSKILIKAGAKNTWDDIGVDRCALPTLIRYSPYVRSRFTILRLLHRLDYKL